MPSGQRQLFVYWRTARGDLPMAQQAAHALQAQLRSRYPGLVCQLYLRDEPLQAQATLMETYAIEPICQGAGIDSRLQQAIDDLAALELQPWLHGMRHVEVFERCTE